MNNEDFVKSIKKLRDQSCQDVIENLIDPPGRRPREKDVKLSKFYHSLNEEQKNALKLIMNESIDMAFFSFFCVLDHVHFIEDNEDKTLFELCAIQKDQKLILNDPKGEELHNLYNNLVLND